MWKRFTKGVHRSEPRSYRVARPLHVERLEDRWVPSTLVALTTDNRRFRFDSQSANQILATTPITGLFTGESILGIDIRPFTAELYGVSSANSLYVIDPNTGAASLKAILRADPTDTT